MTVRSLLLLLSWLPVTEDCLGMPTLVSHYEVTGQHVRLLGWVLVDGVAQPVYSERAPQFIRVPTQIPMATLSEHPLGLGDVAYYDIVAVTAGGLRSDDCAE